MTSVQWFFQKLSQLLSVRLRSEDFVGLSIRWKSSSSIKTPYCNLCVALHFFRKRNLGSVVLRKKNSHGLQEPHPHNAVLRHYPHQYTSSQHLCLFPTRYPSVPKVVGFFYVIGLIRKEHVYKQLILSTNLPLCFLSLRTLQESF